MRPLLTPGTLSGFRPFYVRIATGDSVKTDILYPLFYLRRYPESYRWSILQLVNGRVEAGSVDTGAPKERKFDVWPFYFSLETANPSGQLPCAAPDRMGR